MPDAPEASAAAKDRQGRIDELLADTKKMLAARVVAREDDTRQLVEKNAELRSQVDALIQRDLLNAKREALRVERDGRTIEALRARLSVRQVVIDELGERLAQRDAEVTVQEDDLVVHEVLGRGRVEDLLADIEEGRDGGPRRFRVMREAIG